jgi:hypothetical protein
VINVCTWLVMVVCFFQDMSISKKKSCEKMEALHKIYSHSLVVEYGVKVEDLETSSFGVTL